MRQCLVCLQLNTVGKLGREGVTARNKWGFLVFSQMALPANSIQPVHPLEAAIRGAGWLTGNQSTSQTSKTAACLNGMIQFLPLCACFCTHTKITLMGGIGGWQSVCLLDCKPGKYPNLPTFHSRVVQNATF